MTQFEKSQMLDFFFLHLSVEKRLREIIPRDIHKGGSLVYSLFCIGSLAENEIEKLCLKEKKKRKRKNTVSMRKKGFRCYLTI